ncbi:hypothetical protein EVAR_63689_1 [Eumeta japonica]|uniref:Uncharacterized protein n=1 Tax=Eumeta variegata TaxID=151549 RepID=A0A4C1ZDY6_EUMVA|nr:hypothetical protein EVAR_63689_1 [Eumeta japonica]
MNETKLKTHINSERARNGAHIRMSYFSFFCRLASIVELTAHVDEARKYKTSRWSPSSMDTRNPTGVASALSASWMEISDGGLMEKECDVEEWNGLPEI